MEQTDSNSISLILKVISGIKQNAPDDIHMSRRYAALLEILVNAALRTSQSATAHGNTGDANDNNNSRDLVDLPSFDIDELHIGEEWIYDPTFWETLPEMVGLSNMPSLLSFPG
ncbi:unnamed protein product [Penicillium olsonii]|nr:unnamed protein product [Penicillium olsonii]CAG7919190.1 unnamed protein product [Penicillium olsonii]